MKDSTKKWLTITGGLVICAILVVRDCPAVHERKGY